MLRRVVLSAALLGVFPAFATMPYAYLANPATDSNGQLLNAPGTVAVMDWKAGTFIKMINVGNGPVSAAVNPSGNAVYVANSLSNTISIISTATNQVTGTIDLAKVIPPVYAGPPPNSLVVTADGKELYVGSSAAVFVLSTATNKLITSIPASGRHMIASSDGQFLYTVESQEVDAFIWNVAITKISVDVNAIVATTSPPSSHLPLSLAIAPDGSTLYYVAFSWNDPQSVATYGIAVLSTNALEWQSEKTIGSDLELGFSAAVPGLAFAPDGKHFYMNLPAIAAVSVYDSTSTSRTHQVGVPGISSQVPFAPDGLSIYAVSQNAISVLCACNSFQPQKTINIKGLTAMGPIAFVPLAAVK